MASTQPWLLDLNVGKSEGIQTAPKHCHNNPLPSSPIHLTQRIIQRMGCAGEHSEQNTPKNKTHQKTPKALRPTTRPKKPKQLNKQNTKKSKQTENKTKTQNKTP